MALRERRSNAGSRMSKLTEVEGEDDFYNTAYGGFIETEEDQDYVAENEPDDITDSDFDASETYDEDRIDNQKNVTEVETSSIATQTNQEDIDLMSAIPTRNLSPTSHESPSQDVPFPSDPREPQGSPSKSIDLTMKWLRNIEEQRVESERRHSQALEDIAAAMRATTAAVEKMTAVIQKSTEKIANSRCEITKK